MAVSVKIEKKTGGLLGASFKADGVRGKRFTLQSLDQIKIGGQTAFLFDLDEFIQ